MGLRTTLIFTVLLAVGTSATLEAQPAPGAKIEPSLLVMELYIEKEEQPKTGDYIKSLVEELNTFGQFDYMEKADALFKLQKTLLMPSKRVNDEKLGDIEKLVEQGDKLLYTDPKAAIDVLKEAKTELKGIMESIALNSKIRKDFFKTQMLLARSHIDNKNEEKAQEIMEEIIRIFGDEEKVTEDDYHPQIVKLYQQTYVKMSSQRKGVLTVKTIPVGCEVYLNGRKQEEKSPHTFKNLYPGTYHVLVKNGDKESLVHKVEIELDKAKTVEIDLNFENSLLFGDKKFGFKFDNEAYMKNYAPTYVKKIGKSFGVDYVLLAGLARINNQTNLISYLINVKTGETEKAMTLAVKPEVVSKNRVKRMAAYLSGEAYAGPQKWYQNWIGWGLVGVGVAALGTGIYMYPVKFNSDLDEANELAKEASTYAAAVNKANDAKLDRGLGAAFYVVSGLSIAGAGLMFYLTYMDSQEFAMDSTPKPKAPKLFTMPWIDPAQGGGGLSVYYSF